MAFNPFDTYNKSNLGLLTDLQWNVWVLLLCELFIFRGLSAIIKNMTYL